jgi:hypothetical protein
LAAWEAAFLPDWRWEALEKEEDGVYYGRVRSPQTYGNWEYGYFTEDQLKEAGAYRTDTELGEDTSLYPDGGQAEAPEVFETELDALHYLESRDKDEERWDL